MVDEKIKTSLPVITLARLRDEIASGDTYPFGKKGVDFGTQ